MMNLKRQFSFVGLLALAFCVWVEPVQASEPEVFIDVVEITDPAPFIIHTNILPGDSFIHPMTVKNLTGAPQDVAMSLDIILSEGIVNIIPFELEEQLFVKIRRESDAPGVFLILPGGGTERTLQQLDDTLIELGSIPANSTQGYTIYVVFDENAGNEYQNTKVYFNVAIGLEISGAVGGSLQVFKENDSVGDEAPGNEVEYTLRVTALNGDVDDVELTDLPPDGFVYVPGSGEGAPFVHEYASPGVWNLGDMAEGETKTVTYKTKISGSQDDGLYKDLAFAKGTNGNGDAVLAVDPSDSDNFVGTEVAVAVNAAPTVIVPEDNENKIKEKIVKKIKYVLGAATTLPMTGANTVWLVLALVLLVAGSGLVVWSKRKKPALRPPYISPLMKIFLFAILAGTVLFMGNAASAATALEVRIETPEAVVGSPDFQIGFVTLDILGRDITVECFKNSDVLPFASYPLLAGGSSGNCQINAAVMPADGDYEFYVKAVTTSGANETAESNHVNVKLAAAPGTPYNYDRNDGSCLNVITFTTADDGGKTVKVELYRSLATSFTADASTFVAEQVILSNTAGSFSIAAPGCSNDYFYALRAVNAFGFGSGFVGDKDVNVDTHTVTNTKTTTITTPGAASSGAIAVEGTPLPAGEVQGAETVGEEAVPGESAGSVLGAVTEAVGDAAGGFIDWVENHPWRSILIALILIALGYYGYGAYQRKRNEPLQ